MAFSPGQWESTGENTLKPTALGLLAKIGREREIADILHQLLAFFAAHPREVLRHFALIEGRIYVHIQIAPNRIGAVDDGFFARLDRGRAFGFLYLEVLRAGAVGCAAVADAVLVFTDGLQNGRGAGHGLRARGEVSALEHVLLEELIGAGTVFATVKRDRGVRTTHLFPVFDATREDLADLIDGQFLDRVAIVDINGQTIQSNLVFGRATPEC